VLLLRHDIARVAADPPLAAGAGTHGAWPGIVYYRLHGSPRTYWSSYGDEFLSALAGVVSRIADSVDVWIIFDNTASGAAAGNALTLLARLNQSRHT